VSTALGLLAVVLLIMANGYFVAAEFSFVAAKRARLNDAVRGVAVVTVSNQVGNTETRPGVHATWRCGRTRSMP